MENKDLEKQLLGVVSCGRNFAKDIYNMTVVRDYDAATVMMGLSMAAISYGLSMSKFDEALNPGSKGLEWIDAFKSLLDTYIEKLQESKLS